MHDDPNPFACFSRLEEAATFFLYDAFEHAYLAAQLEVAALIFADRIMAIEPEPGWVVPSLPATLPELVRELRSPQLEILPKTTVAQLAQAWNESQALAPSSGRRLPRSHTIGSSIEIAGHVINLAACVESVVNRHLFLLRESGKLEHDHYLSLDRAETMPKLLFAFKDEILSKKLATARLKHLFRLRNEAVHFKAASATSVRPTVEELLAIWQEVGLLLDYVEGDPTRQEVTGLVDRVGDKWFS